MGCLLNAKWNLVAYTSISLFLHNMVLNVQIHTAVQVRPKGTDHCWVEWIMR